ncbi:MAG: hypothetical protein U0R49_02605 [Fimbriimonadales bacterium]
MIGAALPQTIVVLPDIAVENEPVQGSVLRLENGIYVSSQPAPSLEVNSVTVQPEAAGWFRLPQFGESQSFTFTAGGAAIGSPLPVSVLPASLRFETSSLPSVSDSASPGDVIRLDGTGLDAVQSVSLLNSEGGKTELTYVFGSSLQAGFLVPVNLRPGAFEVEIRYKGGRTSKLNQTVTLTNLTLTGETKIPKGKKAEVAVESNQNVFATIFPITPNIKISTPNLRLSANKPQKLAIEPTAKGEFSISANSLCVANQELPKRAKVVQNAPSFSSTRCTILLHVTDTQEFPIETGQVIGYVVSGSKVWRIAADLKTFGRAELVLDGVSRDDSVRFVPSVVVTPLGRMRISQKP